MANKLFGVKKMYCKRGEGLADLKKAYVQTEGGLFGVKKVWVAKAMPQGARIFVTVDGESSVAAIVDVSTGHVTPVTMPDSAYWRSFSQPVEQKIFVGKGLGGNNKCAIIDTATGQVTPVTMPSANDWGDKSFISPVVGTRVFVGETNDSARGAIVDILTGQVASVIMPSERQWGYYGTISDPV
jgi:hypothetical protein